MHVHRLTLLAAAAALVPAALASAESVRLEIISNAVAANDMSSDGRWVVGAWDADGNGIADDNYRLDTLTGTITLIGGHDAVGVSEDGQVIVGDITDPFGTGDEVAGRWTAATGWQSLGYLPNAGSCPSRSNSYEVSADGSVVVGLSWDGCSGRAFRWTQATGIVGLEVLANGGNRASVLSSDGTIVAGFAQGSGSRTPAWWNGDGEGALLDPPNGDVTGEIQGISDDGTIFLGNWNEEAFAWTAAGGLNVIDDGQVLPTWVGVAMDVADDGTIVGFDHFFGNRRAWIAVPAGADEVMIELQEFVTMQGGMVPSGFFTHVNQAISRDGRKVIGHSGIPTPGAWILHRCPEDVDGNGSVDVTDLLEVLGLWGPCPDCTTPFACPADINGDCEFDVTDLLAVLGRWGPC